LKYRLKHVVEYALLRGIAGFLNLLPYRAALCVGWLVARIGRCLARSRLREAERRLCQVFGEELSQRKARWIAWVSWRNMAFNVVETLRVSKLDRAWIEAVFDCELSAAVLREHAATGRGALIAVPHMGNWELAGFACHFLDIPIFNIAGRQKNPLVNRYFARIRSAPGIETVERGTGSMRQVLRRIRKGRFLAILPDSRVHRAALEVPFLGGTANLGKGMALFARHADVPIFPFIVTREGWTRHKVKSFAPIWPDKTLDTDDDLVRMTTEVIRVIDDAIREQPEQWFWFNRRWVLDPV